MANHQRELSGLRQQIKERLALGQGTMEIGKALDVGKSMVHTVKRGLDTPDDFPVPEDGIWGEISNHEVSRRLATLIRRLEAEDGPLPHEAALKESDG